MTILWNGMAYVTSFRGAIGACDKTNHWQTPPLPMLSPGPSGLLKARHLKFVGRFGGMPPSWKNSAKRSIDDARHSS